MYIWVSGQLLLGQLPLGQLPPGNYPQDSHPLPRTIRPTHPVYMVTPEQQRAADLPNLLCCREPNLHDILSCCCKSFHVAYFTLLTIVNKVVGASAARKQVPMNRDLL